MKLCHCCLVGVFGLVVAAAPAFGQDQDPPAPAAGEQVLPGDAAAQSKAAVEQMRETLTTILGLVQDARRDQDTVRLVQLNEAVTSVKALLRVAEQSDANLQEALANDRKDVAMHEFNKVMTVKHHSDQKLVESRSYVGMQATYTGETVVEVIIEGPIPHRDPTTYDVAPPLDFIGNPSFLDPDPTASPHQ